MNTKQNRTKQKIHKKCKTSKAEAKQKKTIKNTTNENKINQHTETHEN